MCVIDAGVCRCYHLCICVRDMYAYVGVLAPACVCWRPVFDVGCLILVFSTLFLETGSLGFFF